MIVGESLLEEFMNDSDQLLDYLADLKVTPEFEIDMTTSCRDFLSKCLNPDPKERATIDELLSHKFLEMDEKEMYQSREASNFISFFSILASQNSSTDPKKASMAIPNETAMSMCKVTDSQQTLNKIPSGNSGK